MAKLGISTGTSPNDGTGDSLLGGAVKVNSNFDEVYGKLGDGTNLFVGIVSSIAVDGALSISTSYGAPTITGTANTAVVNAEQIYSAGIVTFAGDAKITGVNTFSSAGYDIAGIVTAQDGVLYDTLKIAGITTINSFGVNVGGAVTATTLGIRDTGDGSYVGLNTVTLDNTGIAATAINITDTATLTSARITTATINSGIVTAATVGAAVTINSGGIDIASGIVTATTFKGALTGNVTGNLTGTASVATLATNAQGLTGTPLITVENIICSGSGLNANLSTGIATATSYKVGSNEVISSARKLSNIASLDATTTATIESAIEATPNDFTDLNVAGLATVGTLYVNGRTNGLNISGVTTGLSVSGVTTVGIVTGATSIQVTDVYSNFIFGDVSNATGSPSFTVLTATKGLIGAGVTIDQKNIDAGLTDNINTPFLYRKSTLISCVGEGGKSGVIGKRGGNGGGISIAGGAAVGRGGGVGGNAVGVGGLSLQGEFGSAYVAPYLEAGDVQRVTDEHGRTIRCAKGDYWLHQGLSACADIPGDTQFRLSDGTEVTNTASIARGYKAGYNVIQTAGAGINAFRGGNGAVGGKGGRFQDAAGGGGSGYSDGSVTVVHTTQGGSTADAKVVIRVQT